MALVISKNGAAKEPTQHALPPPPPPEAAVLLQVAAAATTGSGSAATEHTEEPQLAELINQETGLSSDEGPKSVTIAEEAPRMCGNDADLKDVATLQAFTATAVTDYTSPMATLTACQLVDPTCTNLSCILGAATEHLYQLNHVYVVLPSKADKIKTHDDRLFARLAVSYTHLTLPTKRIV